MDPDEIAALIFTSGTTGAPKAAVLRHRHLVSYVLGSVEFMAAGEQEASLVSVPPYHVAGLATLCTSIYAGRRIVQLRTFDADDWVDLAREEEVTHAMVVPTMLARIVERLAVRREDGLPDLRSLSLWRGSDATPCHRAGARSIAPYRFRQRLRADRDHFHDRRPRSEDHRIATASDEPAVRQRLGSVGQALPSVEVSIRDEEGHEVSPRVSGRSGCAATRCRRVSGP